MSSKFGILKMLCNNEWQILGSSKQSMKQVESYSFGEKVNVHWIDQSNNSSSVSTGESIDRTSSLKHDTINRNDVINYDI